MVKGLLVGLVIGMAAMAGVLKVRDRRQPPPAPAADSSSTAAAASDPATLKTEADRLAAANDGLRASIEDRKRQMAAIEEAQAKQAAKSAKKGPSWKTIAPKLVAFMKAQEAGGKGNDPAGEQLMLELMTMLGTLARKLGLTMDEAMLSPEGLPAMMMELFAMMDEPLTDSQRKAIEALFAKHSTEWDAIVGSKDVTTRLEQRLKMMEAAGTLRGGVEGTLTEAQKTWSAKFLMFSSMGGMGGNTFWASGSRQEVADKMQKNWGKVLKLDEAQTAAIRPILEDFMTDYSDAQKTLRQPVPGQSPDMNSAQVRQLEAQIAAQKKIAQTLNLTKEQSDALKGWSLNYNFWVNEREGQPLPVPTDEEDQ